jgi:hypothetical protein
VLSWPAGPVVPNQEAREHETWVGGGGIVLCVVCINADWVRRAQKVFERSLAAAC